MSGKSVMSCFLLKKPKNQYTFFSSYFDHLPWGNQKTNESLSKRRGAITINLDWLQTVVKIHQSYI